MNILRPFGVPEGVTVRRELSPQVTDFKWRRLGDSGEPKVRLNETITLLYGNQDVSGQIRKISVPVIPTIFRGLKTVQLARRLNQPATQVENTQAP